MKPLSKDDSRAGFERQRRGRWSLCGGSPPMAVNVVEHWMMSDEMR